jgi:hypothetical protein
MAGGKIRECCNAKLASDDYVRCKLRNRYHRIAYEYAFMGEAVYQYVRGRIYQR